MADTMAVQRLSISAVGVILASLVASAQSPNGGGPGAVLGIVEIPEMFFLDVEKGVYAPRAALTLYTLPDSASKPLGLSVRQRQLTKQSSTPSKRERSSTGASVGIC